MEKRCERTDACMNKHLKLNEQMDPKKKETKIERTNKQKYKPLLSCRASFVAEQCQVYNIVCGFGRIHSRRVFKQWSSPGRYCNNCAPP